MDPHSLGNIDQIISRHASIHLEADFEKHILSGYVELVGEAVTDNVSEFVMDSRNLSIERVCTKDGSSLKFCLVPSEFEVFGTAIKVTLESILSKGEKCSIRVYYQTSPKSSAIQWLDAEQTAGKLQPYMYTQCQAIHARSLLPCQDAPSVKITYDASLTVRTPLIALMSAKSLERKEHGNSNEKQIFYFRQNIPISTYLIAIAIGELEARELGEHCRVWSEKSMVDKAAYEFADTEKFLKIAEELLGPYVWERYDILMLPPSFPYGGMENPNLTFVTPTLISGDRSNADVIAHELSHSWSGNLVTNRTWEHFWLNEGITVYAERMIYGKLYGEPMRHFKATTGWKDLRDSVERYGENDAFTAMIPCLKGVDPDDAFSSVPYEKGFNFLFYLETLVGGIANFQPFIKAYLEKFKFGCVTSDEFRQFFLSYFQSKCNSSALESIDWEAWFYKPGLFKCSLFYISLDYGFPMEFPIVILTFRNANCNFLF